MTYHLWFYIEKSLCFRSQSNSLFVYTWPKIKMKTSLSKEDCYIHRRSLHFSTQIIEWVLVRAMWFKFWKISKGILIQESIHNTIQSSSSNETGKMHQLKLSSIAMCATALKWINPEPVTFMLITVLIPITTMYNTQTILFPTTIIWQ